MEKEIVLIFYVGHYLVVWRVSFSFGEKEKMNQSSLIERILISYVAEECGIPLLWKWESAESRILPLHKQSQFIITLEFMVFNFCQIINV